MPTTVVIVAEPLLNRNCNNGASSAAAEGQEMAPGFGFPSLD
jgi:hypothetical protein